MKFNRLALLGCVVHIVCQQDFTVAKITVKTELPKTFEKDKEQFIKQATYIQRFKEAVDNTFQFVNSRECMDAAELMNDKSHVPYLKEWLKLAEEFGNQLVKVQVDKMAASLKARRSDITDSLPPVHSFFPDTPD